MNRIWVLADILVLLPFLIAIVLIVWHFTDNGKIDIEEFDKKYCRENCTKCCGVRCNYCPQKCTKCCDMMGYYCPRNCTECCDMMCNACVGCATKLNSSAWKDRINQGERAKNVYKSPKEMEIFFFLLKNLFAGY